MNSVERFHNLMNFRPVDRLPMVEWAGWWNKTIERWHGEGLDPALTDTNDIRRALGLEPYIQDWLRPLHWEAPKPPFHGAGVLHGAESFTRRYEEIGEYLYRILDRWPVDPEKWRAMAEAQRRGDSVLWFTLDGFFWFPRTLFGIEAHLYSFYDEPELLHRINRELADWMLRVIDRICEVATPDFMTFAEDLSYNHGPMLSEELFDEFLLPYYRMVTPVLKERGIRIFIDSDGDITRCLPWFERAGIEGVLPLERQAGVDLEAIRRNHPRMLFIGHFDKMTMTRGEAAMRAEFERLLPVARQGGFIPSVDHQTPPGVSLADYRIYVRLLEEFCHRAATG